MELKAYLAFKANLEAIKGRIFDYGYYSFKENNSPKAEAAIDQIGLKIEALYHQALDMIQELDNFHSTTETDIFNKHLGKVLTLIETSFIDVQDKLKFANKIPSLKESTYRKVLSDTFHQLLNISNKLVHSMENLLGRDEFWSIKPEYMDHRWLGGEFAQSTKEPQTSLQKPTVREALTQAHKANGGRLTNDQLKELVKKHRFNSLKYVQNLYGEIWEDLK